MPVASEVNPFQREVGGNQKFVTRARPQNGAVIPDSGDDGRLPSGSKTLLGSSRHLANPSNQRFFGRWHGPPTISDVQPSVQT
jgi:hypothetical protein